MPGELSREGHRRVIRECLTALQPLCRHPLVAHNLSLSFPRYVTLVLPNSNPRPVEGL